MQITIDGRNLTLEHVKSVAVDEAQVVLSEAAIAALRKSRDVIEQILAGNAVVYGVNTGFGRLSEISIPAEQLDELQLNLVRSHSAGVGDPLSIPVTRAMMLLRANVLARGNSGIRPEVVQLLVAMLNRQVHPVIPSRGSVGASGDLAPLAHLALVLIGEGDVHGDVRNSGEALRRSGLSPVILKAKEGLALINGTQAMAGIGGLAWIRAAQLVKVADIAGAMSVEAMRGTDAAFDDRIMQVRPHAGAITAADNLRSLINGSQIRESHRHSAHKVQDHYSLRCIPQVHGAVRDALEVTQRWIQTEINSATDNPLVFPEQGEVISGGNFHGAPMSLCFDFLAIAVCQLASISERRTALLVDSTESDLPPFLTKESGINSGFMIAQVTAAALTSENKILAHPASVDTIPTSANKEDHVSMGVTAALKLEQIVRNTTQVLAIELLCAAQGIDLLKPLKTSGALQEVHRMIREHVAPLKKDRVLATDIEAVCKLIESPEFVSVIAM